MSKYLAAILAALVLTISLRHANAQTGCGQAVTLVTHNETRTTYSLGGEMGGAKAVLVLLPGGGGFLDLDSQGCPNRMKGNSLARTRSLFQGHGFLTALIDAPSDHQAGDGLGGFRIAADHAEDIGKVIEDVRRRTKLPVWLIGSSRGAISAVNAASRLSGSGAPDGLVLTSAVTSGREGAFKAWVAQTVFSVDLEKIKLPVLVVAHVEDKCVRTPPDLAADIAKKTDSKREQTVLVTGGPGWPGRQSVKACRGKSPHGFVNQETEVTEGIARFVLGGNY